MNERDSENISAILENMGYKKAIDYNEADLIILNTCAIRENAHNKVFGMLGRLKHMKEERPLMIGLCGCMAQEEVVVNEIMKKYKYVDLVFGTHKLFNEKIEYKSLGLLVIDEEQRFGVMHKEKIKEIKSNVHVLSVSATPIPRSLQMSLIGVRDLSLIETPPVNKLPVQTYVISYDAYVLRDVVLKEKARGGQVFILYNKA